MAVRTLAKTGERTVAGINPVSVPFGIISYPSTQYILISTRLIQNSGEYGYRYYRQAGYGGAYVGNPASLINTIGGFFRYGYCNNNLIINMYVETGEIYTVLGGNILDLSTFTVGGPASGFTFNALATIPDYTGLANLNYVFLTPNSISCHYMPPASPNVNFVQVDLMTVNTYSCFSKSVFLPSTFQDFSTIPGALSNQYITYAQSISSIDFTVAAQSVIIWERAIYGSGLTYQFYDLELSDPADNVYFQANRSSFIGAPNNGVDVWIDYQATTGDNFVFRFYDNFTKYEKILIADLGYIYNYFRDKDGLEYGLSTSGGVVYELSAGAIPAIFDINKWPAFLVSNPVLDIKENQ